MAWRFLTLAILFSACLLLLPLCAADPSTDESTIRGLVGARQQQAWNQHNAHAYAALFAEDGDSRQRGGMVVEGPRRDRK